MIQIASGLLRGTRLVSPTGSQTRPSGERLRQAIFNVLRHYSFPKKSLVDGSSQESAPILEIATVADLFAGSGALGIEALSNGARNIYFVENHPLALRSTQENLRIVLQCFERQGLEPPQCHLLKQRVEVAYKSLPELHLILCDPPYQKGWFEKVLKLEEEFSRLVPGGLLIFEANDKETLPLEPQTLRLFDTKIYGDSAVHFFVKR